MKNKSVLFLFLCVLSVLMIGCGEKDVEPSFNSADLVGKWQVSNSQEFWRYNSDGSGLTWDEAQDVHEDDETTMRFSWSLSDDRLSHVFSGDEVHQAVVQDYTVKELTSSKLVWNDGLQDVKLVKVN